MVKPLYNNYLETKIQNASGLQMTFVIIHNTSYKDLTH